MAFSLRLCIVCLSTCVCLLVSVLIVLRLQAPQMPMKVFVHEGEIYRTLDDGFQPITNMASSNEHPSISPDGRWLVFLSDKTLYKMHPFGRRITSLQSAFEDIGRVSWSPNGAWIVFAGLKDNRWDIYRMRPSGNELQQLTTSYNNDAPAWSPDGEWIVFNRRDARETQIFRIKPDGSQIQQVSDGIGDNRNPVWSPAGESLVFLSNRELDDEIYRMRFDGSNAHRIGQRPSYTWYRYPRIWVEGWIVMDVFRNGFWGTYQMRPDGTELIAMSELPQTNQMPASLSLWPVVDQDWCGLCVMAVAAVGVLISFGKRL